MQHRSKSFGVLRLFLTPFQPKSDQDFKALCKDAVKKSAVTWVSRDNVQHFLFLFCKWFFHLGVWWGPGQSSTSCKPSSHKWARGWDRLRSTAAHPARCHPNSWCYWDSGTSCSETVHSYHFLWKKELWCKQIAATKGRFHRGAGRPGWQQLWESPRARCHWSNFSPGFPYKSPPSRASSKMGLGQPQPGLFLPCAQLFGAAGGFRDTSSLQGTFSVQLAGSPTKIPQYTGAEDPLPLPSPPQHLEEVMV